MSAPSYTPPASGGAVQALDTQAGAAYTLALGDAGKLVRMTNAGANVVTIPPDVDVPFQIGTVVYVMQGGAGAFTSLTTIAAGAGVTIAYPITVAAALENQYSVAILRKVAANTWSLDGHLDPRCCSASATTTFGTNPVIPNALVRTPITFTGGTASWWAGGAPTRLTIPAWGEGIYVMRGAAMWAGGGANLRQLRIDRNGNLIEFDEFTALATQVKRTIVSYPQFLAAGDYIELSALQNSAGNVNINGSGDYTSLALWKVE